MDSQKEGRMRPILRHNLVDDTYTQLKQMIIDREIEPESWLLIEVLRKRLKVSTTPIREALVRLESNGLIRKMDNGRYQTQPLLTQSTFNDLYNVRLQLEPFAAGLAAANISENELYSLSEAELSMHLAPTGNSYETFSQFNQGNMLFHDIISKASGNSFLYKSIKNLNSHYRVAQLYLHNGVIDAESALKEHADIVSAIKSKDTESTRNLMRSHIERSRRQLELLTFKENKTISPHPDFATRKEEIQFNIGNFQKISD